MSQITLISADSHINEPPNTFVDRVPARLKDRAPRVERTPEGDVWIFESGAPRPIGLDSMAGRDYKDYQRTGHTYEKMRRGAFDPKARLEDMTADQVNAEVIYPGVGFRLNSMPDPELQLACMRAYNDWLAEFCAAGEGRLAGLGLLPLNDIGVAVDELKRIGTLGLQGAVLPAVTPKFYSNADYDPIWAAAAEQHLPLSFHIGGMRGMTLQDATTGSKDGTPDPGAMMTYMAISKMALAEPLAFLIFSGALQRHPDLQIVLVEGGFSWLAYLIAQMDVSFERHRYWTNSTLEEPPSVYFHRQVRATFIQDKPGMAVLHLVGADNVMWSSDYPHSDSTWPKSQEMVAEQFAGVSEEDKAKIVAGNAAKIYHLN